MVCAGIAGHRNREHNNSVAFPYFTLFGDSMIGIEEIGTQTLYKRVGDSVTVKVRLHNSGNATGTVNLRVEVYEPVNGIWIRITNRLQGDDVSVSPGSTVTKSYSFKPVGILPGERLRIKAYISGDSSDTREANFDFSFTGVPYITWHGGSDEFKILQNFPSKCDAGVSEKHTFRYGETVRMMYRAFNFDNEDTVRVLFTMIKEITANVYWLKWQGISTMRSPQSGYYWSCYWVGWNHTNYPRGIYLAYVTAEMIPGYSTGVGILDNYFSIY